MADRTVQIFDQETQQPIKLRLHDNGDGTYSYAPFASGIYNSSPPSITNGQHGELQLNPKGWLRVEVGAAFGSNFNPLSMIGNGGDTQNGSAILWTAESAWNGSTYDRLRVASVFKPIALAAGTAETAIWTPTTGKKFRLMGFMLTSNATSLLTFNDGLGGSPIFYARGANNAPIITPPMGNGILSAAANNVLTVTRGTSSTLEGVLYGTEE